MLVDIVLIILIKSWLHMQFLLIRIGMSIDICVE